MSLKLGPIESSMMSTESSTRCCVQEMFEEDENTTRYSVVTVYSLVFGVELAYKIISRTGIFLLNPCHITTMLQLALLTMTSSQRITCFLFRFHMYTIPGAMLAITFPILNTRLLPGEVFVYYVQHIFIILIPLYMMCLEGAFIPESIANTRWPILSLSIMILYHFTILQLVGLYTQVNLNCIICPAVSDPFKGPLYRITAVAHQSLFVPLIAKLYNYAALLLVASFRRCAVAFEDADYHMMLKKEG
ncbi:unnamed protein product [Toxocara canis]|uniref:Transmembrane protein 164 n=1 Tax=Toxocara canis TaxID=6265 RepID=A0A183V623_TOXCA|nr:unnamed protein product [Toxocara canis]